MKLRPCLFTPHADGPDRGVSAADEGVQGAQVRPGGAAAADEADRDPRVRSAGSVGPAGRVRSAGQASPPLGRVGAAGRYPTQIVRQSSLFMGVPILVGCTPCTLAATPSMTGTFTWRPSRSAARREPSGCAGPCSRL